MQSITINEANNVKYFFIISVRFKGYINLTVAVLLKVGQQEILFPDENYISDNGRFV